MIKRERDGIIKFAAHCSHTHANLKRKFLSEGRFFFEILIETVVI